MQLELFGELYEGVKPEDEMIEKLLSRGSGYARGNHRIYNFALTNPSVERFAVFLKDEYGVGGSSRSVNEPNQIQRENHDAKGIEFDWLDGEGNEIEHNITWKKAAEVIIGMVKRDEYQIL